MVNCHRAESSDCLRSHRDRPWPRPGRDAEGTLWRRGGLPRSFLAATEEDSVVWRHEYVRTLLERDFPQWGVRVPAAAMGRFWAMLAHYHAQTWNAAEPA